MLKLLILLLIFGSAGLLFAQALPNLTARYDRLLRKKTDKTVYKLDKMFYDVNRERMFLILTLTPFVLAGVAYMVTRNIAAFAGGLVLGITFPSVIIKKMEAGRKEKFRNQLIDALLTVSACLKSGLSLLQAIEVIAEEMPPPISKEFNLVLNENKVGVTLEEALERLNKRLYSEELNMLVTSILVSRHTGGDLSRILERLVYSIRQKNKIAQQVKSLTIQARYQGMILMVLPIIFAFTVTQINPGFFKTMFEMEKGRMLLLYAVVSQILGMFTIIRLSKVEV